MPKLAKPLTDIQPCNAKDGVNPKTTNSRVAGMSPRLDASKASLIKQGYFEHLFPPDTQPCDHLRFELSNVRSDLISFEGDSIPPVRKQKGKREQRYTEANLSFKTKIKIAKVRVAWNGTSIELIGAPASTLLLPDTIIVPKDVEIISGSMPFSVEIDGQHGKW